MTFFRTVLKPAALTAAALLFASGHAAAQNAGFRMLTVPGDAPTPVALFYPTTMPARVLSMGPWQPTVAPGAPAVEGQFKGLILLSHGTGGTEFNHHNLATRLAKDGYLVAAPRHLGDNWEDRSLITSGRYFSERPRQISRVLDALLASPEWGPRIPAGRIGAVGHSAGGYSVMALAGAQAEPGRAAEHCRTVQDDPGFCSLAKAPASAQSAAPRYAAANAANAATQDAEVVSVADRRITAVVVMAPMAVVLTPESMARITVPVRVIMAEKDAVLTGKYHGARIAASLPNARTTIVPSAGHFAFMSQATIPLPSAAGDAASNPVGFDRMAYLPELENQVAGFFAAQWK